MNPRSKPTHINYIANALCFGSLSVCNIQLIARRSSANGNGMTFSMSLCWFMKPRSQDYLRLLQLVLCFYWSILHGRVVEPCQPSRLNLESAAKITLPHSFKTQWPWSFANLKRIFWLRSDIKGFLRAMQPIKLNSYCFTLSKTSPVVFVWPSVSKVQCRILVFLRSCSWISTFGSYSIGCVCFIYKLDWLYAYSFRNIQSLR